MYIFYVGNKKIYFLSATTVNLLSQQGVYRAFARFNLQVLKGLKNKTLHIATGRFILTGENR